MDAKAKQLEQMAAAYGTRIDSKYLLEEVGLTEKAGSYVENLFGGQKQRFSIVASLVHKPKVFFMDEPTTGLHFQDIQHLADVLNKLVDRGNTVLVIEHNMDIIKIADHIIDLGPEGGERGEARGLFP